MQRRRFIKSTAAISLGMSLIPREVLGASQTEAALSLLDKYTLKGFDAEREESPAIVANKNGEMWLFSLHRMDYPHDTELISSFAYDGVKWKELNGVTKKPGQFESPVAACPPDGQPVVAWTEIKNNNWFINVARMQDGHFSDPQTFRTKTGNSANPVIIAPQKNRIWLAWENLHKGKFTISLARYENGKWSEPLVIDKKDQNCFDPALAEDKDGNLYLAYGLTDGFHQNIAMDIINGQSLTIEKTVSVATGGAHKNRVNINAKPALAFDADNNLWISYESNRNANRPDDGDNYTGDRCCAILSYQNNKIKEVPSTGKWLFKGVNDHKPTFVSDCNGNLYLATHCGGDFTENGWKYRISWLDPENGWSRPVILHNTQIKGFLMTPAIAFDKKNKLWLATINDKSFVNYPKTKDEGIINSRLSELELYSYKGLSFTGKKNKIEFKDTRVEEYRPDQNSISTFSGRPKHKRKTIRAGGETYTLLFGNLHDHSNSSNCWPAGCDGTLHENYRFGMYSEAYDFVGMTDHAGSTSESHWRRNIRTADFYNESGNFVAIPAVEWTLPSNAKLDHIQHGAGHYNIIFASSGDAQKYVRNRHELYCPATPESQNSEKLWKMLDSKHIDCVTIPHHPADKVHPVDWNVTDPKYVTVVELFQCRGNSEYPGCPREKNLERHEPTRFRNAWVDYALKTKKHKMGFIASGDHNNMGIGLAALWVKEVSREGIIEALKNRRTYATTGDKIYLDFRLNEAIGGETVREDMEYSMSMNVNGQYPLEKIEVLRNSEVIHTIDMAANTLNFEGNFRDKAKAGSGEALYYYLRVTQKNKAVAWSSPVWIG